MKKQIEMAIFLMLVLAIGLISTHHVSAENQATIWTDKEDYSPGETVHIFGENFLSNSLVSITVVRPDGSINDFEHGIVGEWTIDADENGAFETTYQLNGIEGIYTVSATDGFNIASTTFTDDNLKTLSITTTAGGYVNWTSDKGQLGHAPAGTTTTWINITPGSKINFTAYPLAGYYFVGWGGDLSGNDNPRYNVQIGEGKNVTASFALSTVQITITSNPTGSGFVNVDGSPITTPQTFSWTPGSIHNLSSNSPVFSGTNTKYVFTNWSDGGAQSHSYVVPSSNATVTAYYDTYYKVTYAANVPVTLPPDEWVKNGSSATGVFPSQEIQGDVKYVYVSDDRPANITAPTTITATYDTYYKVTFKQSGSGVNPTVTYHIDGGSDITDTVEFYVWVLNGSQITYSYQDPVTDGPGTRFVLTSVDPASPQTVTSAFNVTGTYKTQYRQRFQGSGYGSDATDGLVTITITGGEPSGTYNINVGNGSRWVDAGANLSFAFKDPVTSSTLDKRYRFDHDDWSGSNPYTVTGPNTITGYYVAQWKQYFTSSGLDADATDGLVSVTISAPYGEYNINVNGGSRWADEGATVTYTFKDPVTSSITGKRYRLDSATGPSSGYTVSSSNTITGYYITQYRLTFKQTGLSSDAIGWIVKVDINNDGSIDYQRNYTGLAGDGKLWVDNNTEISYEFRSPVPGSLPNTQYWLQSITGPTSPFTVTQPETITGNYMKLPYSSVTTSSLCPFDTDKDPNNGQQFNLLFTRDITDLTKYKLTASNPGQFYYNAFYIGTPGETINITLIIPQPFETQGAVPIHIYAGVDVSLNGCFIPYDEISSVALPFGTRGNITIENITVPDSGLVYVTIHLDFGWKKQSGYNVGINNFADNINNSYDLQNLNNYIFSYKINDTLQPGSVTIQNINIFKNDPGFFGIVTVNSEPVSGAQITIKDSSGKTIGVTTTDENGYYFFYYKYTGKEAKFTVILTSPVTGTHSKVVTLKSNKFVWVPFEL